MIITLKTNCSFHLSDEFDGVFEMHPTNVKHLYMVDAGLTFNSPYPVVLRPQREVDIILSFDFSARPSDTTPPFKVSLTVTEDYLTFVLIVIINIH